MVYIDYQYYGKLVFAPVNIIIYNVFTSHGPDLYGMLNILFVCVCLLKKCFD
jgi:hypothetical protein